MLTGTHVYHIPGEKKTSEQSTKSGSSTYQRKFVVTVRSNKGQFAVRNTSPITLNVK
jgi:hypothetical protein